MTARYAIYFAPPPEAALWRFGSQVIGYDAETGAEIAGPDGLALPPDWPALTEEPRRYGFHATLKAPFQLGGGCSEADLLEAARLLAARRAAFVVPRLEVALLGSFVALVPAAPSEALDELAADCVRSFDHLRAPMSPEDRQRRLKAGLSERQTAYLDAWGYPYVFEEFRFHMTLTGSLPPERRDATRALLAEAYEGLAPGLPVEGVALFRQDDRAGRFRILARLPFAAEAAPRMVPRLAS
jgi:putative phosphonate metabolism protein